MKKKMAGAPAWMVTFADLMALLLTMFVLLLSFSTMEIEKFRQIAGTMNNAFGLQAIVRLAGFIEVEGSPVGEHARVEVQVPLPTVSDYKPDQPDEAAPPEEEIKPDEVPQPEQEEIEEPPVPDETFTELQESMAAEIAGELLDVLAEGDVTIVRFPDKVAFPSGSGDLSPEFLPVLDKVLDALKTARGHIIVSGHTDDVPIYTAKYRSNWDLSTARAVSVVHYILEHTEIPRERISVQGFADSRPLAPNDSEENRSLNRRVEITIQRAVNGDAE